MKTLYSKIRGFTLIEMILVTLIISTILVMVISYTTRRGEEFRRDKAVTQIQQTLNAGLAFYMDNSRWPECTPTLGCVLEPDPASANTLQERGYLPNVKILNPWGGNIFTSNPTNNITGFSRKLFSVCIQIPPSEVAATTAGLIAAQLPMGVATADLTCNDETDLTTPCTDPTLPCNVISSVNIPGLNINNARSVNFTGIYRNGACVPAPECPHGMAPEIIVAPTQVNGMNNGLVGGSAEVFPISSFTATAKGPISPNPEVCTDTRREDCSANLGTGIPSPNGNYWRVCLIIETTQGKLQGSGWQKESGSVMAMTRCVPTGEPAGSDFDVFQNY
jgi:prepilin-type N-terminal cleavage/methylation domain-containing protein